MLIIDWDKLESDWVEFWKKRDPQQTFADAQESFWIERGGRELYFYKSDEGLKQPRLTLDDGYKFVEKSLYGRYTLDMDYIAKLEDVEEALKEVTQALVSTVESVGNDILPIHKDAPWCKVLLKHAPGEVSKFIERDRWKKENKF